MAGRRLPERGTIVTEAHAAPNNHAGLIWALGDLARRLQVVRVRSSHPAASTAARRQRGS